MRKSWIAMAAVAVLVAGGGALIANAQVHHTAYSRIAGRLTPQTLAGRIARDRERVASFAASRSTSSGKTIVRFTIITVR